MESRLQYVYQWDHPGNLVLDYLNSEFGAQRFPQCVQKCESDVNKMKLKDIIPEKRCKELKVRYMDPMCPIYIWQ